MKLFFLLLSSLKVFINSKWTNTHRIKKKSSIAQHFFFLLLLLFIRLFTRWLLFHLSVSFMHDSFTLNHFFCWYFTYVHSIVFRDDILTCAQMKQQYHLRVFFLSIFVTLRKYVSHTHRHPYSYVIPRAHPNTEWIKSNSDEVEMWIIFGGREHFLKSCNIYVCSDFIENVIKLDLLIK